MNDLQKQAVEDTIKSCFPTASEGFQECAKEALTRIVKDRNDFHIRPEQLSLVNRVMWKTYNLIIAGPK